MDGRDHPLRRHIQQAQASRVRTAARVHTAMLPLTPATYERVTPATRTGRPRWWGRSTLTCSTRSFSGSRGPRARQADIEAACAHRISASHQARATAKRDLLAAIPHAGQILGLSAQSLGALTRTLPGAWGLFPTCTRTRVGAEGHQHLMHAPPQPDGVRRWRWDSDPPCRGCCVPRWPRPRRRPHGMAGTLTMPLGHRITHGEPLPDMSRLKAQCRPAPAAGGARSGGCAEPAATHTQMRRRKANPRASKRLTVQPRPQAVPAQLVPFAARPLDQSISGTRSRTVGMMSLRLPPRRRPAHPGCPGAVHVQAPLGDHAEAPHLLASALVEAGEDLAFAVHPPVVRHRGQQSRPSNRGTVAVDVEHVRRRRFIHGRSGYGPPPTGRLLPRTVSR